MSDANAEPRRLLPVLNSFYERAVPFSWLVLRVAVGWNLLMHAWPKLLAGPAAGVKGYTAMGFEPALFWAWASTITEGIGGIGIILGLFTRFCAAAVAIEMFVIFVAYWNNGFGWGNRGYEYVLLWGLAAFAIALRGGGPYSLDRTLGVEL